MISINSKGNVFVWLAVVVAVIGLVGAGYFVYRSNYESVEPVNTQESSVNQPVEKTDEIEEVATGKVITTNDSEFGTILFDGAGQAIYIWELEQSTTPECYGNCAEAWPPVLTDGEPVAAGSVNGELLGTTERTDGTIQITYNGHPLYYYADEEPGEVKCHNIFTHGGLWWVIQPNGLRAA